MMNIMLYSMFGFQLTIIITFASLSVIWAGNNEEKYEFLNPTSSFFIQLLTYWVAYSHLIPISLYVVLEIIKLSQRVFINNDIQMYDKEAGFSKCRNSDLIEEMG